MIRVTFDNLVVDQAILSRINSTRGNIIGIEANGPYMILVVQFFNSINQVNFIQFLGSVADDVNLDKVEII